MVGTLAESVAFSVPSMTRDWPLPMAMVPVLVRSSVPAPPTVRPPLNVSVPDPADRVPPFTVAATVALPLVRLTEGPTVTVPVYVGSIFRTLTVVADPNVQLVDPPFQIAVCAEVGAALVGQAVSSQLFQAAVPQSAPAVPRQYLLGTGVNALKVAITPTQAVLTPVAVAPVRCGAVAVSVLSMTCMLFVAVELTVCSKV